MANNFSCDRGNALPMGLSRFSMQNSQWHNFSIFAPGQSARLEIRDESAAKILFCTDLSHSENRTGDIWHVAIDQLPPRFTYAWRFDIPLGQLVCDPRAELLANSHVWRQNDNKDSPLFEQTFALVIPDQEFDWKGDIPPRLPWEKLVFYEVHVRGFTQSESSGCIARGTFAALTSKLEYLKWLGVNAIELMPIHEFAEGEYKKTDSTSGEKLCNYWGYSTRHFFTPMRAFANPPISSCARQELKELVRQAHLNGIEIILDVVYNHTGEGDERGPKISFKALAEDAYYLKNSEGKFINHSGCGNTFNANHPIVIDLILASLRHMVTEYRVDGFRFDLATLLMRNQDDSISERSSLLSAIAQDPLLANAKLIAEPWDPSGVYRVGNFPFGNRFSEWNDRFRDDVREFLNFGKGKGKFASRLCGSQDLFSGRSPHNSINFIACHDGFTLKDLVSYSQKHNEVNAENNQDGSNNNYSFNFGCEGPTSDPAIEKRRIQQMKNFLLALFVSQGVPLLLSGDEYGHTRFGNNNSWCHDSEINWFQWNQLKDNELLEFTRQLIALRKERIPLDKHFLTNQNVLWHGKEPNQPRWEQEDGLIAMSLESDRGDLYIAFNASQEKAQLQLPKPDAGKAWQVLAQTSQVALNKNGIEKSQTPTFVELLTLEPHTSAILTQLPV